MPVACRTTKISHWTKIICLASLSVIVLSSCSESGATAWDKHHKQGVEALKQRNFSLAISEFQAASDQAKELAPDDIRVVTTINDLAAAYAESGHSEKCQSLLEHAEDLEGPHQEQSPQWRVETSRTALGLANVYRDLGEFGSAQRLYEKSSSIVKDVDGCAELKKVIEDNAAKERSLAQAASTAFESTSIHTQILSNGKVDEMQKAGWLLPKSTPFEKAESVWLSTLAEAKRSFGVKDKHYRQVLESAWAFYCDRKQYLSAQELINDDMKSYYGVELVSANSPNLTPESVEEALSLSKDLQWLSMTLRVQGKIEESLPISERSLAIRQRCGPKDIELVKTAELLADSYNEAKKPDMACQQYRGALSVLAHLRFQQNPTAQILSKLARVEGDDLHDYVAAEQHLTQLIDLQKSDPSSSNTYMQTLFDLTAVERRLRKYTQAQSLFEQAIAYGATHKSTPDPLRWSALMGLGQLFMEKKEWNNATQAFQHSYQFAQSSKDKQTGSWLAGSLRKEAEAVTCQRGNAEKLYRQSIALAKESHDCNSVVTSTTAFADYFNGLAQFAKAEAVQKELLAYVQHDKTCSKHAQACVYWDMAGTELCKGDLAQADSLFERAVHAEELQSPPDWPILVNLLINLGYIRGCEGRPTLAEQSFVKAAQLCKNKCSDNADLLWCLHVQWSCSSWLCGHEEDCARHLKIATEQAGKRSETPAQALSDTISALNRFYIPGAPWESPTDLASATGGVDAMRNFMGADNPCYVAMLKQLEVRFALTGRVKEAEYFKNRAENARRAVVHH